MVIRVGMLTVVVLRATMDSMRQEFRTITRPLRHEIDRIRGSRFIADITPVKTVDEARERISRVRSEFHDARHHCWAYRLGGDGEVFRSSDDGEPSGSAGRPILKQIEGHDVTDVVIVVTRYFGGTKLGVGGLVRAYGAAAAAALDAADIRTIQITREIIVEYPYACSRDVEHLMTVAGISPSHAEYGESVRLRIAVPVGHVDDFVARLRDATSGRASIR